MHIRESWNVLATSSLASEGCRQYGGNNMLKGSLKGSLKSSLKSSQKIIELLAENPHCTYDSLAEIIGISRRAVTKQIQRLRQSGRLRRVGPDKGGHWEVIEK